MLESDIEELGCYVGDSFKGANILITGGSGFLGRYFCEVLHRQGANVIAVDNFKTSAKTRTEYSLLDLDVNNGNHLRHNLRFSKFDYILHMAGIASPFHYRKYPFETLEVATTGLKNVLGLAQSWNARTLFFSSSEIYGDPSEVPTTESYRGNVSCLGPRACYDESKRLGETISRLYFEQHGLPIMIVRPFNVYGPGMRQDDYRVLPSIAAKIIRKEPIQIYGDGTQTRTFCYITDAVRGFLRVLKDGAPGEPYNVGNDTPEIGMLELAKMIRETEGDIDIRLVPHPESYPADEPQRRCPDLSKLKQLSYAPLIGLERGLERFFKWARANYTA